MTASLVVALGLGAIVVPVGDDPAPVLARADAATVARVADLPPVDRAWAWVQAQTGSPTDVVGRSSITASRDYPADWTGPVTGTFRLRDAAGAPEDTASLAVDAPADLAPDSRGTVRGHLRVTPAAGRWIVQVYRVTAAGRQQVGLQALAQPDGSFALDLDRAGDVPPGRWALGLLDAWHAYAPHGTPWPAGTYPDLTVRAIVVTDTAYTVSRQPARADGTFAFDNSRPGAKVFQLVDERSGDVLAEAAPGFGLVRSRADSARVYTYDQAMTVVAGLAADRDVRPLVDGLLTLQRPDGGFVESADVRNPAAAAPVERSGISAVAVYALLRAVQSAGPSADLDAVRRGAAAGLDWLQGRRRADGLIDAGTGDRRADGTVDPAAEPGWASTEHNIDAWQALQLAATVLPDAGTRPVADALSAAIVDRLWDPAAGRFRQGIAPDGAPDDADPLDVNSWGALFLHATGRDGLADRALAGTARFASEVAGRRGYRAYYPQPAFPTAPANVWAEGSAGVAIAAQRLGRTATSTGVLADLRSAQRADGGIACAATADAGTSMTDLPCLASAAWFIVASSSHPIWNGR